MATATLEEDTEEQQAFDRQRILSHIDRYYLGGEVEHVKWTVEDGTFFTRFVSPDNTIIGELTVNEFPLGEDVEIGIYGTKSLKKLLKILDDEFTVSFERYDGTPRTLILDDDYKTVQFRLADLSVIPDAPNLKKVPPFQVRSEIGEEFISNFRSAERALDEDEFAVRTTTDGVEVVVGYSSDDRSQHTNKVDLPLEVEEYESFTKDNVTFKSDTFAEMLKANSDAESAVWEVSDEGLARLEFEGDNWSVTYYMVSQQEV